MPTTNGLPYPSLTDAPNLPAAVQALAEAVDARYGPTVANAAALSGISSPFKGMRAFLDDIDMIAMYDGSSWLVPGWQTLSLTGTTGWTVNSARAHLSGILTGPRVELRVLVTRTGGTITSDASGNITDTTIATGGIPSALLPSEDVSLMGTRPGVFDTTCKLTSGGTLSVTHFSAGSTGLSNTQQIAVRDSFALG